MGTDDCALAAIDAEVRFPDWDLDGDRPLLDARCAGRERTVRWQRAHGKQITFTGEDPGRDALDELRDIVPNS